MLIRTATVAACYALASLVSPLAAEPAAAPDERIVFVGQQRTSTIRYSTDLTVLAAIVATGGINDFGSTPVHLIRCGRVIKVGVRAFRREKQDIPLQPWDVILIGVRIGQR